MVNETETSFGTVVQTDKPVSGRNATAVILNELLPNATEAFGENITDLVTTTGKTTNYRFLYYVIYAVIMIPTIFGNTLILASIARYTNLRKSMHILIGNLAFADLLVGVVVIPFDIIGDSFPDIKKHKYVCLVDYSIAGFTLFYSSVSLLLIAIDRFLAVAFPFQHMQFGGRKLFILISTGFVFAVIWSLVPLLWNNYIGIKPLPCYTEVVWPEAYRRTIQFMWISAVLMSLILYCVVFRVALKRVSKMKQMNNAKHAIKANAQKKRLIPGKPVEQNCNKNLESNFPDSDISEANQGRDLQATTLRKTQANVVKDMSDDYKTKSMNTAHRNTRITEIKFTTNALARDPEMSPAAKSSTDIRRTIMMVAVLIVFAVCWSPYLIVNITLTFYKSPLLQIVQKWLLGLGMLNSGMNWIIYSLSNKEFKEAFISILKCKG